MRLFCFGLGYTAQYLIRHLNDQLLHVAGTCRGIEKIREMKRKSVSACLLEDVKAEDLIRSTHILVSIPPFEDVGDVVLSDFIDVIKEHRNLKWFGYLSTTGVYGDSDGAWVDEDTIPSPASIRARRRLMVEQQWLELFYQHQVPTHIFRLAGIYGPFRNIMADIKMGRAKSIDKPGQYFSRTHVEDIAGMLAASMYKPTPGEIYNVCDNEPTSSVEVQQYAAELLGVQPPPIVPYGEAILSVIQREFYATNRRVRNSKIKERLAYNLLYPSYKEGLKAIFDQQQFDA